QRPERGAEATIRGRQVRLSKDEAEGREKFEAPTRNPLPGDSSRAGEVGAEFLSTRSGSGANVSAGGRSPKGSRASGRGSGRHVRGMGGSGRHGSPGTRFRQCSISCIAASESTPIVARTRACSKVTTFRHDATHTLVRPDDLSTD